MTKIVQVATAAAEIAPRDAIEAIGSRLLSAGALSTVLARP